jgi:hypothetical protein
VDGAKEIRDRARAVEVYAKQAQNREAERKAAEIRIRTERRAGQLLKEMKQQTDVCSYCPPFPLVVIRVERYCPYQLAEALVNCA